MIDWSQTAAVGCEEVGDHRNLRDLESLPRGSRVLLELPPSLHLVHALVACWELGLVAVPVDPCRTGTAARAAICGHVRQG